MLLLLFYLIDIEYRLYGRYCVSYGDIMERGKSVCVFYFFRVYILLGGGDIYLNCRRKGEGYDVMRVDKEGNWFVSGV